MIRCLAFFCLLWPSVLWAEAFPAFYTVTGVQPNDMLNVRTGPGVTFSVIDKLPHDSSDIEVITRDETGDWGQINVGEVAGWVSLRFLARQNGQPDNALPRPLVCTGTEPFWILQLPDDETAELSKPDETPVKIEMLEPVTASNRTDRYAVFGQSEESVYTFIFHRDQCSDGMTDRAFGISVDLFLTEQNGVNYVTGCCALSN